MSRLSDYELSHLILRFEQEKDMKVMHCVQNLGALRDLVDCRIELQQAKERERRLEYEIAQDNYLLKALESANARLTKDLELEKAQLLDLAQYNLHLQRENARLREALTRIRGPKYGFLPTMQEMVQIAKAALAVPPAKEKP